jgi:TPR repeat protein
MDWYRIAAEKDHAGALSNLGFMYEHGQGVEEDEGRALTYYVRAAKKGDAYAIKNRDLILAHRAEHELREAALEAQKAAQEAHKPAK